MPLEDRRSRSLAARRSSITPMSSPCCEPTAPTRRSHRGHFPTFWGQKVTTMRTNWSRRLGHRHWAHSVELSGFELRTPCGRRRYRNLAAVSEQVQAQHVDLATGVAEEGAEPPRNPREGPLSREPSFVPIGSWDHEKQVLGISGDVRLPQVFKVVVVGSRPPTLDFGEDPATRPERVVKVRPGTRNETNSGGMTRSSVNPSRSRRSCETITCTALLCARKTCTRSISAATTSRCDRSCSARSSTSRSSAASSTVNACLTKR